MSPDRTTTRRLDRVSGMLAAAGLVFFLISAFCYLVFLYILLTPEDEKPPHFTLLDIGNIAGIAGMVVLALFIITALIVNRRISRGKKTGKDIDDNPEPGAAERS